ncbi:MAG: fluoride efflux transporter CrcB [Rhodospirillales bacterium]|nr:fluoride efflux transporter CrcB [Rhodospirillales bacterium]
MQILFAIAAGGAIGAVLRHFTNNAVLHVLGHGFPWGIFVANVLGSFLMGVLISAFAHAYEPSQAMRAFLTVGMLGAFTTFSTFSMDTVLMIERGQYVLASAYVLGSVTLAIGGLFAGMMLVRMVAA